MDYLPVLLVPFRPALLFLIGIFALAISFFVWAVSLLGLVGISGIIAAFILNTWVLKYSFVLLEHVADGATEPPVMDIDMVSPFESRPMMQAVLLLGGATLCWKIGGDAGLILAMILLLAVPAQVALLGMGDNLFQAMNPLAWFRVVRGMGPLYLLLLAVLAGFVGLIASLPGSWWIYARISLFLFCEVSFFALLGGCIWIRRRQLGYEPSRSPERAAAKQEAERVKARLSMLDEMFQNARLGKHVDATAPLALWLRDLDEDVAVRDALHVADQAVQWKLPAALNPIGSTLIRHLLRFGRPDAALKIYEKFRRISDQFTMDSAPDLRVLAEYADSVGKQDLAQSMRLETPVFHPPT